MEIVRKYLGAIFLLTTIQALSTSKIVKRSLNLNDSLSHVNDNFLPRSITPKFYKLELNVDPEKGDYNGTVVINITCKMPTTQVVLYSSESIRIHEADSGVFLLSKPDKNNKYKHFEDTSSSKNLLKRTNREDFMWYNIILSEPLIKNTLYEIRLVFHSKLNENVKDGFFRGSYTDDETGETRWYAATDMKDALARTVFPCFDEPFSKVPIQISVAAHKKYDVMTSSVKDHTETLSNDWMAHHFTKTPPLQMSSVGIAVTSLPKKVIGLHFISEPVTFYARSSILKNLSKVEEFFYIYIRSMEIYLNDLVPCEKIDILFLPDYSPAYPASLFCLLLQRETTIDPDEQTMELAESVTSQWFTHLVSPYWYTDKLIIIDIIRYMYAAFEVDTGDSFSEVFHNDVYIWYGDPEEAGLTRQQDEERAIFILRMLNYTYTEMVFRDALHSFIADRRFKTFTDRSFWELIKREGIANGKIDEDFNMQAMYSSWMNRKRYPVVTVNRNYESNSASISQKVFLRDVSIEDTELQLFFYILIMLITEDNMPEIVNKGWMKNEKSVQLTGLPEDDKFIIVNPEEIGMFIVNYDPHNWKLLSEYLLKSVKDNGILLPVKTRAKLLNDALTLAYAGELSYDIAFNMTLFLKYENHSTVWQPYMTMVDHLSRRTEGTTAGKLFEDYSVKISRDLLKRHALEKENKCKYIKELRQEAKYVIKRFTNEDYLLIHKDIITKWMKTPDTIPEATEENFKALEQVLKWGSDDEYEFVLSRFFPSKNYPETETNSEIISRFAGFTRGNSKIKRFLNMILLNNTVKVSESCLIEAFSQLSGHYEGFTTLFEFIEENFEVLKTRLKDRPKAWKAMFGSALNFKTEEGLNKAIHFYEMKKGQFGCAEDTVQGKLNSMKKVANWSKNNLPVMENWLKQQL